MKVKRIISCSTKNVIYLIKCLIKCLAYVEKTQAVKTRIAEHRSYIRNQDQRSPVTGLFREANHPVASLRHIGIEHVKALRRGGDVVTLLLKRESFYIFTRQTLTLGGLDYQYDIQHFV